MEHPDHCKVGKTIVPFLKVCYTNHKSTLRGGSIMPTLTWIGKEKVVNHHLDVPYKVLEHRYTYLGNGKNSEEIPDGNKIIRGDNLEALKALLPQYEGKIKCIFGIALHHFPQRRKWRKEPVTCVKSWIRATR